MADKKVGVHITYLKDVQKALRNYVRNRHGNEEEISDYNDKMFLMTLIMKQSDANYAYASEVTERCIKLILLGEKERALTEYKFMVDNLKKEYNF